MTDPVPNAPIPARPTPAGPISAEIALVAYEGAQMSALLGLGDMFDVAARVAGARIAHRIVDPARLPDDAFDAVLLPPNLTGARGGGDPALIDWIAARHAAGALLASACAGAFWLGRAGALDGRPVTTHWALEAEFRAAFPRAQLHPDRLLVDDGDLVTAGGVMAWTDLGLALLRRWGGPEAAARVCRHMLIDPHRPDQSAWRIFLPRLDHPDDAVRALQRWMEGHAERDLSLPALAARAGMSPRTLQRRFAAATGLPLRRYVQELRVEKARGLLARTAMPVAQICWAVGYEDPSAFSRLFLARTGMSAGDWRRRFAIR